MNGLEQRLDILIQQNDELLAAIRGRREPSADAPEGAIRVREPVTPSVLEGMKDGAKRFGKPRRR